MCGCHYFRGTLLPAYQNEINKIVPLCIPSNPNIACVNPPPHVAPASVSTHQSLWTEIPYCTVFQFTTTFDMPHQIVGEQNSGTAFVLMIYMICQRDQYPAAACSDVSLFHIDYPFVMQYSVQQYSNGLVLLLWIWDVMDLLLWHINCLHHFLVNWWEVTNLIQGNSCVNWPNKCLT